MPPQQYKYKAFISYSHQDKKWGDWLHKALEAYRVPKGLIGKQTGAGVVPKRLFPIFRDREELPTSHELGKVIDQALRDSSHLVVICSPRSAKSQWVNEEIKQFKRLGKPDNVLCLIVDGEPNAADKPDLGQEECFPEAAKYEIGEDGELSNIRTEPIAADAREGKDGKRNSLLKVVAGLLAVGFDDLKQRDLVRKQKRMAIFSGVSMALVAVMTGLTLWAFGQQREAERQRATAVQAQQEAETQREAAIKAQEVAEAEKEKAARETYVNSINNTKLMIDDNHYSIAKKILWSTPESLRSLEWGVLMGMCHMDMYTLQGTGATCSKDGKRVLTYSDDKTARIWDAETGKKLFTLKGHTGNVRSVAFSPDGRRVITGSLDKTAKVWDAKTGKELLILEGHPEGVYRIAFSPDGRLVVTASGGFGEPFMASKLKIWNAETGKELFMLGGSSAVFSPDGRRVLSGIGEVWNAETGKKLFTLKGHTKTVRSVAFSPDGRRVITGSYDETARIWEAETGKELLKLRGHESPVFSAVFSPDGRQVLTCSLDDTARIWDAETGEELVTLEGHTSQLRSAAFSPDGRRIVTACEDGTAKIWDIREGKELRTLKGHVGELVVTAFFPDGRRVLTSSVRVDWNTDRLIGGVNTAENTTKIWNIEGRGLKSNKGWADSAIFSPDGRYVLTFNKSRLNKDWEMRMWDAGSGIEMYVLEGNRPVDFSPDGRRLVVASEDKTARIWDVEIGKELLVLKGHTDNVGSVAFSPDGRRVITGSLDKTAKVWDAKTGKELLVLEGNSDAVYSVAFSPDGLRVFTGCGAPSPFANQGEDEGELKIWDARTGTELLAVGGFYAQFSPDNLHLLTMGYEEFRIFTVETGKKLVTIKYNRWDGMCEDVVFSPDGSRLATRANNDSPKIWDTETGKELLSIKETPEQVKFLRFSPDGRRVITSGGRKNGAVKIWDSQTGKELLRLKHARLLDISRDGRKILVHSEDGSLAYQFLEVVDWTLTKEEFLEQKRQRYEEWVKANVPKPEETKKLTETADAFYKEGKYHLAKSEFVRAYTAFGLLEEKDPATRMYLLKALCNTSYQLQQHDEVIKYATEAMTHAKTDPDRLFVYDKLGATCQSLGELGKALGHYEKSLAINLKTVGPEHPDVASSCNVLGIICLDIGKNEKALPYIEQALAIQLKKLGPVHPDVAISYWNKGRFYGAKGDKEKAMEHLLKAKAIFEKKLGPEHHYKKNLQSWIDTLNNE